MNKNKTIFCLGLDSQAFVRIVITSLHVVHVNDRTSARLIDICAIVAEQTIVEHLVLGQVEPVVVVEATVGGRVDAASARYIGARVGAYEANVLQRARIQPAEVDAKSGAVALGRLVYLAQCAVTRVGEAAEEGGGRVVGRGGALLVLHYLVLVVSGLDAQEREQDQAEQAENVEREQGERFVAVLFVQVVEIGVVAAAL